VKPKILVIDDDEALLQVLQVGLEAQGFEVTAAENGPEGVKAAFRTHPDLVLLDIMMPDMDGYEVSRRLRELSDVPIIFLTALSSTPDIVRGLGAGAEDYIVKPFAMAELVARVKTRLPRDTTTSTPVQKPTLIRLGSLTIDIVGRKAMVDGKPVNLTPTEFRLLAYLARHPGCAIPHRVLLTAVWGPEFCDQVDYLHLYIRYLRQKLERNPCQPKRIKTERGIGYYLEVDV
jgi:two-component system KDP operon response regulator KdpE